MALSLARSSFLPLPLLILSMVAPPPRLISFASPLSAQRPQASGLGRSRAGRGAAGPEKDDGAEGRGGGWEEALEEQVPEEGNGVPVESPAPAWCAASSAAGAPPRPRLCPRGSSPLSPPRPPCRAEPPPRACCPCAASSSGRSRGQPQWRRDSLHAQLQLIARGGAAGPATSGPGAAPIGGGCRRAPALEVVRLDRRGLLSCALSTCRPPSRLPCFIDLPASLCPPSVMQHERQRWQVTRGWLKESSEALEITETIGGYSAPWVST